MVDMDRISWDVALSLLSLNLYHSFCFFMPISKSVFCLGFFIIDYVIASHWCTLQYVTTNFYYILYDLINDCLKWWNIRIRLAKNCSAFCNIQPTSHPLCNIFNFLYKRMNCALIPQYFGHSEHFSVHVCQCQLEVIRYLKMIQICQKVQSHLIL